jgi:hypothetical protein
MPTYSKTNRRLFVIVLFIVLAAQTAQTATVNVGWPVQTYTSAGRRLARADCLQCGALLAADVAAQGPRYSLGTSQKTLESTNPLPPFASGREVESHPFPKPDLPDPKPLTYSTSGIQPIRLLLYGLKATHSHPHPQRKRAKAGALLAGPPDSVRSNLLPVSPAHSNPKPISSNPNQINKNWLRSSLLSQPANRLSAAALQIGFVPPRYFQRPFRLTLSSNIQMIGLS